MRFPSEAFEEIASQEQEGKIEKNRLGCFQCQQNQKKQNQQEDLEQDMENESEIN